MLQEFHEQGIPTHIAEITSRTAHGSEEELPPPRNNECSLSKSLRTTRSRPARSEPRAETNKP